MIMKVKEPIKREWPRMRQGQVIFTYFHFAADERADARPYQERRDLHRLRDRRASESRSCRCYADVRGRGTHGGTGGAKYLEKILRRTGVLLGGVPGVAPAKVVVLGGGIVGSTQPRWRRDWAPR
jgi:alanine dehydrogenase